MDMIELIESDAADFFLIENNLKLLCQEILNVAQEYF